MRSFLLAFAVISQLATAAWPECGGRDIRPDLTAAEVAELDQRLSAYPYAAGNHWRARRGSQMIHLVGTVHIDDPRLDPVIDTLAPLIREAELLYVEGTAEQEAKLQRAMVERPELVFITEGPTLPDLLPDPLWQDLTAAMRARGMPGFIVAKMQPWFLSVMLSLPACRMTELQAGQRGLDDRIMAVAEEAGVPIRALEPYDTLFRVAGADPLERQAELLQLGILPEQVTEDVTATLMESYFEEKTAELLEVNRFVLRDTVDLPAAAADALLDEMLDKLLDARNRLWLPLILEAPDGVTVVAVGAGHLPGRTGLLNLLAQEGYTLERQPFRTAARPNRD